jgi:hypothetical protein
MKTTPKNVYMKFLPNFKRIFEKNLTNQKPCVIIPIERGKDTPKNRKGKYYVGL